MSAASRISLRLKLYLRVFGMILVEMANPDQWSGSTTIAATLMCRPFIERG